MAREFGWKKTVILLAVGGAVLFVLWQYLGKRPTSASVPATVVPHDHGSKDVANETLQFIASQFRDTQQTLHALSTQQSEQANRLDALAERLHVQTVRIEAMEAREAQVVVPETSLPALQDNPTAARLDAVEDLTRHITPSSKPASSRETSSPLHETKAPEAIPYYTIPANATAIHTTLMTALVGRIPQKGKVQDPYPFKLLLDQTILAANGLELDALAGMVVSGVAVGDLSPQGARGWITSLTFLFADGTIQTVGRTGNDALTHGQNTLGYLTDPYGNPAIEGTLITDAPRQIGQMMALGGARGAASALSEAQITQERQEGRLWRDVTGNRTHYLLGHMGTQAIDQVMSWLGDRMASTFDAIFVPAGQPVVIHFTQEIPIDYRPDGRRLVHANTPDKLAVGLD